MPNAAEPTEYKKMGLQQRATMELYMGTKEKKEKKMSLHLQPACSPPPSHHLMASHTLPLLALLYQSQYHASERGD